MPGDAPQEIIVFVVILALITILFLKITHKVVRLLLVVGAIAALMIFVVPNFV